MDVATPQCVERRGSENVASELKHARAAAERWHEEGQPLCPGPGAGCDAADNFDTIGVPDGGICGKHRVRGCWVKFPADFEFQKDLSGKELLVFNLESLTLPREREDEIGGEQIGDPDAIKKQMLFLVRMFVPGVTVVPCPYSRANDLREYLAKPTNLIDIPTGVTDHWIEFWNKFAAAQLQEGERIRIDLPFATGGLDWLDFKEILNFRYPVEE